MGEFWRNMSTDELIMNYNAIEWSLQEKLHCRARCFEEKYYVAPQFAPESTFDNHIKPGALAARRTIKELLAKRLKGQPIPFLELNVITDDQMVLMELGWETYKEIKRAFL